MEFYPVFPADAIGAERGADGAPTGVVAIRPATVPSRRGRGIGAGGRDRRGAHGRGPGVLPSGGGGAGDGPPGRGGAGGR